MFQLNFQYKQTNANTIYIYLIYIINYDYLLNRRANFLVYK